MGICWLVTVADSVYVDRVSDLDGKFPFSCVYEETKETVHNRMIQTLVQAQL